MKEKKLNFFRKLFFINNWLFYFTFFKLIKKLETIYEVKKRNLKKKMVMKKIKTIQNFIKGIYLVKKIKNKKKDDLNKIKMFFKKNFTFDQIKRKNNKRKI